MRKSASSHARVNRAMLSMMIAAAIGSSRAASEPTLECEKLSQDAEGCRAQQKAAGHSNKRAQERGSAKWIGWALPA